MTADACNYLYRELSWLSFNSRVLEEAADAGNPLLERARFLSIVSTNLDEFFMVRVASLYDQIHSGYRLPDASGMAPKDQYRAVTQKVRALVGEQYACYKSLMKSLRNEGIRLLRADELSEGQRGFVDGYYRETMFPVLTPMMVDAGRPFPLIQNRTLNIALLLGRGPGPLDVPGPADAPMAGAKSKTAAADDRLAIVHVPTGILGRAIRLPSEAGRDYILAEEIARLHLGELFKGHEIKETACFRIMRNADQGLQEEDAEDLLEAMQEFLHKRKRGMAIRLEIESGVGERLLGFISDEQDMDKGGVYLIKGPVDLSFLFNLERSAPPEGMTYGEAPPVPVPEFMGAEAEGRTMFEVISGRDVLAFHPYQSFDPVVRFVEEAAHDPDVLAIKQTLYRVSANSPVVNALAAAAESGKSVTVLVELKARFDEENNIRRSQVLERAGCHVIYGLVGLKTHCKVSLVVRREEEGIRRYVHVSTGNYNDLTARVYTDLGLFTANPYFGADASALFNMLSGYTYIDMTYKMVHAPLYLRDRLVAMIAREAGNAAAGMKARIVLKVNSLTDKRVIDALYEASRAGVAIDLIVRGICCLKPSVPGLSENITVRSIVGRYLEHARILYFHAGGEGELYLSSADLMDRNLDRRVETMFPIEDPDAKETLMGILELSLADNVKARLMGGDGEYRKAPSKGRGKVDSQTRLYEAAAARAREAMGNPRVATIESIMR
ncbi:MAG: polyphosphate kinase 1 [Oscillospiraceae bacterium]|nr:polyphosphate kinase 1 [Oscillospiraceae bacterium]